MLVAVVALVMNDTGQMWLMRRTDRCRDEHWRWDIIGGGLEEGETAEQAMRRELKEEIGIGDAELSFLGYRDVMRPGLPHVVALDFVARTSSEPLQMEPDKHDLAGWFDRGNLPAPMHSQWPVFFGKYAHRL